MLNALKTFISFTKNIATTGAVYKTSKQVEREICSGINANTRLVIEFGAGQGNITREILRTLPSDARLISFEVNADFCHTICEQITDKRLHLVNGSALDFGEYVQSCEVPDVFISSLPLTIMNKGDVDQLLARIIDAMNGDSSFHQVMYSKVLAKRFKQLFGRYDYQTTMNLPPAFVFHCRK